MAEGGRGWVRQLELRFEIEPRGDIDSRSGGTVTRGFYHFIGTAARRLMHFALFLLQYFVHFDDS